MKLKGVPEGYTLRQWEAGDISRLDAHSQLAGEAGGGIETHNPIFERMFALFPEGQFLVEKDDEIVGFALSAIVQWDEGSTFHSFTSLFHAGRVYAHHQAGDTLLSSGLIIEDDHWDAGLVRAAVKRQAKLLRKHNLKGMLVTCPLPGYAAWAGRMMPQEYAQAAMRGEMNEPAFEAYLVEGFTFRGVVFDLAWDGAALGYLALLELVNQAFKPEKRRTIPLPPPPPSRKIRVCAAQYLMRPVQAFEDLERSVTQFVHAAVDYRCQFLVLPEYFTAQLFTMFSEVMNTRQLADKLGALYPRYRQMFTRLAQESGTYIIGGSTVMPGEDGALYNVSHLFTPGGRVYTQEKLHITPWERNLWDISPGRHGFSIFQTPLARIGIQVCYDIEFPEIARQMALMGAEIIFVPFSTDDQKAYRRVQVSAQARAIENYLYTVISGNTGVLPHRDYLLNYGQSAVYTPSDIPFPIHATAGEADPNVETTVIVELDLGSLAEQRTSGAVRPLHDRRTDLYTLAFHQPIRVIYTD